MISRDHDTSDAHVDGELSLTEARSVAVEAQGLSSVAGKVKPSLNTVIECLGCVQVDALSAVRRSQELVLLSRGVALESIVGLYTKSAGLFETWGHAHSLLPVRMWPYMRWRRERIAQRGLTGPALDKTVASAVLAHIGQSGPATLGQMGKIVGTGWERTSPVKTACEWLLSIGELVVIDRNSHWERIYRTRSQAGFPFHDSVSYEESIRLTVLHALQALGIAQTEHVRDYFRLPKDVPIDQIARSLGYVKVGVHGTAGTWLVHPSSAERATGLSQENQDPAIVPLSPFDSLIWTRSRQRTLFGKHYVLEAYKPIHKREFGYFAMPILVGTQLAGRIAARATAGELLIENFELDPQLNREHVLSAVVKKLQQWTGSFLARETLIGSQFLANRRLS